MLFQQGKINAKLTQLTYINAQNVDFDGCMYHFTSNPSLLHILNGKSFCFQGVLTKIFAW